MSYKGALYGRAGGKYFPLIQTSDDVDRMQKALEEIRDREWVENALDPQWAAGKARAVLKAPKDESAEPQP